MYLLSDTTELVALLAVGELESPLRQGVVAVLLTGHEPDEYTKV